MAVYVIAALNIADREGYRAYEQGFMAVFGRFAGKLLAVDEQPAVEEGEWPYSRTVLIEFPDTAAFEAWFHSPDYQALAEHRRLNSSGSVVVVKGLGAAP